MELRGGIEGAGANEPDRPEQVKRHPIQVVSLRTGLSKDVLRAWERRYEVVRPDRTDTGRRLYSDDDVARLRLLKQVSGAGRTIKQLAGLPDAELSRLAAEDEAARELREEEHSRALAGAGGGEGETTEATRELLEECLSAVESLDRERLRETLDRAVVTLPPDVLVEELIAPMMQRIGLMWWEQRLNPRHEHLASTTVRETLDRVVNALDRRAGDRPRVVCATPNGQLHEIGALLVAVTAATAGWRVTYLGADLPVEEIAASAVTLQAEGVAISLVHPEDDPELPIAIRRLRQLLLPDTRLFAGGRAASDYRDALEEVGAEVFGELASLRRRLVALSDEVGSGAGGSAGQAELSSA